MLTIRGVQLDALHAARHDELAARIARRIETELPADAADWTGEQLRAFALHACRRASRWNLRSDASAFILTVLFLTLGPSFDGDPGIAALLANGSEEERIRALVAGVTPELVNELRSAAGDPAGWPERLT